MSILLPTALAPVTNLAEGLAVLIVSGTEFPVTEAISRSEQTRTQYTVRRVSMKGKEDVI
jgi:hypothetical protein